MRLLLAAAAVLSLGVAASQKPAVIKHRTSRVVTIKALQFTPAHIVANIGDTIVWRNADVFSHTATSHGTFDTGELKAGTTGRWIVTKRGVMSYACLFHPTMKGVIDVK